MHLPVETAPAGSPAARFEAGECSLGLPYALPYARVIHGNAGREFTTAVQRFTGFSCREGLLGDGGHLRAEAGKLSHEPARRLGTNRGLARSDVPSRDDG